MDLKVYGYKGCDTCRKTLKYLDKRKVKYIDIPIRDNPPSTSELKKMFGYYQGQIKKLFNTSGQDYRALNLKEKINQLSEKDAIKLLSSNGNLIKRPFVLGKNWGTVGFAEDIWDARI